jgi:type IV fimbrial biogenesis protein FimT
VTARPHTRGFTLIELMVALAIAAILLLIAGPSFTTFLRNSEIRSTSESLLNGLKAATAEAANRNRTVTFELTSATASDWKFWVLEDDGVTQKILQTYSKNEAGSSSKITVTPAGQLAVKFNGLGRVTIDPVNPDDHIRQIDITSVVAGEARPLRIIVDDPAPPAAGRPRGLRLCDPDPALAALSDPRAC